MAREKNPSFLFALCLAGLVALSLVAAFIPVRACPWCFGNGRVPPNQHTFVDEEMLECCVCKGRKRISFAGRWKYEFEANELYQRQYGAPPPP